MSEQPDTPTRFSGHGGVGPSSPLPEQAADVSSFTAEVEFRFVAESLGQTGSSLRDLAEAARATGFELRQARVEPAAGQPDDRPGWTRYGPGELHAR